MKKLITIAVLTFASAGFGRAAKLCIYNFAIGGKFTVNNTLRKWAVGPDCMASSFGSGSNETTETNPMNFCPNVKMHGISKLINSYNPLVYTIAYVEDQPEMQGTHVGGSEERMTNCFCKVLYPKESPWFMMAAGTDATGTPSNCNGWCGNMIKQSSFSNQLLSFGGWN